MELLHGFLTALPVYGAVTFGFSAEGPMWSSAPTGVWADGVIGPYGRSSSNRNRHRFKSASISAGAGHMSIAMREEVSSSSTVSLASTTR